jgi:hypothetical protein
VDAARDKTEVRRWPPMQRPPKPPDRYAQWAEDKYMRALEAPGQPNGRSDGELREFNPHLRNTAQKQNHRPVNPNVQAPETEASNQLRRRKWALSGSGVWGVPALHVF